MAKPKANSETAEKRSVLVLTCSCKGKPDSAADYQDRLYGPGKRVHTIHGKPGKGDRTAECTVCGSKRPLF